MSSAVGPFAVDEGLIRVADGEALYVKIIRTAAALRTGGRHGDARHHTAGGMSRWLPWLAELQPEMFAEIDPLLAADRGIEDGGWMTIVTERAEIEARALVTDRIRPMQVDGQPVHRVAMPWHYGFDGVAVGDSANDLIALAADPNVSIHESRAFTCNVRAGRRARPSTAPLAASSVSTFSTVTVLGAMFISTIS